VLGHWYIQLFQNAPVVEEGEHRSRRNVKFIPYREGAAYLQGVDAPTKTGTLTAYGVSVSYKPASFSAEVFPRLQRTNTAVGEFTVTTGAAAKLRGVFSRTELGTNNANGGFSVSAGAAAQLRGATRPGTAQITGVRAITRCGTVASSGGAAARMQWTEEAEAFVGDLTAAGIQNPTDEELALVALLLTRKNASRTMRSNH